MIALPEWYCPNCGLATRLPIPGPRQTHFHTCPRLRGLSAPLLPIGVKAKVVAVEREDYVGNDKVQTDEAGRPVMSIVTVRDNGQDAVVFAPSATVGAQARR